MGAGPSVQIHQPLSPGEIFNICAQGILEIIAPGKDIGTKYGEVAQVDTTSDDYEYLSLGGDERDGLRKKLSLKERQLFIGALAFVIKEIGGNSSALLTQEYLKNYNSRAAFGEVRIPLRFIERQFGRGENLVNETLEKFEKIQNYAFYSNAATINPRAQINASEEEISAGVKAYFDEQALEDLKTDIAIGNPLNIGEDLSWLEERGFNLQAVEEKFSLVPYAVRQGANQAVIKHLIENLGCDLGNRAELFLAAAEHSNIETVKYLHDNYPAENQRSLPALHSVITAYLNTYEKKSAEAAVEKDEIAAFLISKGFTLDENSRQLLMYAKDAPDLALLFASNMIAATKELAKKSNLGDFIETMPRLAHTKFAQVISDHLDEIRAKENRTIKGRDLDPEEPEYGGELTCPISCELMKHPVQICDRKGTPLYPHTFDQETIESHLIKTLTNPLSRDEVPSNYKLITNAEILEKVINHYTTKYMPVIEKLIEANCPLKAFELLNSIDRKTIYDFQELHATSNEIEELRKWHEEKKQEILKLARNKPIELSFAENLVKQDRDKGL